MPPGDRGPALRLAALRQLMALDALEAAPREPGRDATIARARRIATRKTSLRQLLKLAKHHGISLPPVVAERADPSSRKPPVINTAPTNYPMWSEDLSEQPHHAVIRDLLRRMVVEEGIPPAEVLEAALGNAAALSLEVKGLIGTSLSFYRAGAALAQTCPEIQAVAAESLRLTNAMADRVAAMGGQRPPGMARADH